jgi:hypothetical protein
MRYRNVAEPYQVVQVPSDVAFELLFVDAVVRADVSVPGDSATGTVTAIRSGLQYTLGPLVDEGDVNEDWAYQTIGALRLAFRCARDRAGHAGHRLQKRRSRLAAGC